MPSIKRVDLFGQQGSKRMVKSESIIPENIYFDSFTKREVINVLFKYKVMIVMVFISVTVVVLLGLNSLPPTYISKAKVLISTELQGKPSYMSDISAYMESNLTDTSSRKLETEMQMMVSRSLVEEVIRSQSLEFSDLYHKPIAHFSRLIGGALKPVSTILKDLTASMESYWNGFKTQLGLAVAEKKEKRKVSPEIKAFNKNVEAFTDSISISPTMSGRSETKSNILEVEFKAADPEVAQAALGQLLDDYKIMRSNIDKKVGSKVLEVIDSDLKTTFMEMGRIQTDLRRVMSASGYSTFHLDNGSDSRWARVNKQQMQNGSLGVLKTELAKMEVKLARLQPIYTDKSPSVSELKQSMSMIRKAIAKGAKAFAAKEMGGRALEREYKIVSDRYVQLKKKYDQITLFLKLNESQDETRTIVQLPTRPDSSEWRKTLIVSVFGSVLGLLLGLVMAGFKEYTDHRLTSQAGVRSHLGLDLLTTVPFIDVHNDLKGRMGNSNET
jgi:uncharacterized protein involved in exopolysaccharide biosynthesis